jgi:hypothetical protein
VNKGLRIALAVGGLICTPVYWTVVFDFALAGVLGDCPSTVSCFPESGRRLLIFGAPVVGTAIYGLLIKGWLRLDRRLAGGGP